MPKRLPAVVGFLLLAACQRSDVKVLIGATTVTAPGAAPIEDSVIVVAGRTIRSVGLRQDVPVTQDSERTDLRGKWVAPADGARIAPGEPANLVVLDHANGAVVRRLTDGQWQSAP
jgi:cytosine/adenosine deaminase-related metal-dependent hydrolase